jgi:hypothetical protein
MDLKVRVPFGTTGRMVSRLGLASGYGVSTAAIEKAFHEHGVNYLYLSLVQRRRMVQAIRNLAAHRDELFIALARPTTYFLERLVERWHFFQIRYNAVHPGAEKDVFPHLPREDRPGIVAFTATCWGKLFQQKWMPPGERPPKAADCYRFVLSHPDVDVCVTGPSTAEQLEENLAALSAGPLADDEMARIRRIGRHIHDTGKSVPIGAR